MPTRRVRRPIHVGSRLVAGTEAGYVVTAIPTLAGEVVERIRIDALTLTRDEEGFDQPTMSNWYGVHMPMSYGSVNSLTTALMDDYLEKFHSVTAADTYLGGEANPSGEVASWLGGEEAPGYNSWFRRHKLMRPVPAGYTLGVTPNLAAGWIDEFSTRIDMNREFPEGVLLLGIQAFEIASQTTFGVTEMDNSASRINISEALREFHTTNATSAKVAEVLWGGDNYIEADSFKNQDRRAYALVQAHIRLPEQFWGV